MTERSDETAPTSLADDWAAFEWQEPCKDQYEKGYARGYENAMHRAAADLRERSPLATPVTEYGVRDWGGTVIHDPSWRCEADVIHAMHGLGYKVPRGVLLTRTRTRYADELTPWGEVRRG